MKIALQYLNDIHENSQVEAFKLKFDLKEAFKQVSILKQSEEYKRKLNEFLNEP